jgi:hypothetical protein
MVRGGNLLGAAASLTVLPKRHWPSIGFAWLTHGLKSLSSIGCIICGQRQQQTRRLGDDIPEDCRHVRGD